MTSKKIDFLCYLMIAELIAKNRYEGAVNAVGMIDTSTVQGQENFEALGRLQEDWNEARERTLEALKNAII